MAYAWRRDEPGRAALRRLAKEAIDGALGQVTPVAPSAEQSAGEAVHEVRKACKRLRALLRLFRPGLGKVARREDRAVRDIGRLLSSDRDRAVLATTCANLGAEAPPGLLASLTPASAGVGEPFHEVVRRLKALRGRCDDWRLRRPRRSAAAGAARVYSDACRRLADCEVAGLAEPWHAWRKQVKYHGYHARLLAGLHPASPGYHASLKRLGETLGREHDLSVLLATLEAEAGDGHTELRERALAARTVLREEALTQGRPLFACPPKRIETLVRWLVA